MATTLKQLKTAYDSLSRALYSYSQATSGAELANEIQQVERTCEELAVLLTTKIRKGRAADFVSLCQSLVTKAEEQIALYGMDVVKRRVEYRCKLLERLADSQSLTS